MNAILLLEVEMLLQLQSQSGGLVQNVATPLGNRPHILGVCPGLVGQWVDWSNPKLEYKNVVT